MLTLVDVSMEFGDQPLLWGIDLGVQKGESLVLLGPSGRGKTVLLKILAGLVKPTRGLVMIEDKDIHRVSRQEREKLLLRMGMLFQKNALFDSLKVGENIAFPLREKTDLSEAEIQERVEYFLEQVGLSHARDLFPSEISGGMQKRLGIARALALEPEIILYDDPTAGLDPITSRRIADMIVTLKRKQGSTIVVVTNDMARAYQIGDRIAMVVDGEVVVTGDKTQTISSPDPRVQQFVRGKLKGPLTELE